MATGSTPRMAHIAFRTHQFQKMLEWYQAVFGAKIMHQNSAIAFLTFDGEHHRFAFVDLDVVRPDLKRGGNEDITGIDHMAYTLGSIDDLLSTYARLKDKGITPYWCVHHGVTASMYFTDPDGNQIELQVDCFGTEEESLDFMVGEAFANNPVGIEYDPDQLVETHQNGDDLREFLASGAASGDPSPIRGSIMEGA